MLGRAAFGGGLLVGVRLLSRLGDLITMLVLARLLDPKSFGLVAVAMGAVTVFDAALELPIHNALLRHSVITKSSYDTAFTLSIIRGLAVGLILALISIPFANFYHEPRLTLLVCTLSLAPIGRGLISPKLAGFQKELSFWRDFTIESTGKFTGLILGVATGLLTHSYWAIVVGNVSYPLAMVVVSYFLAPYRPAFTLKEFPIFLDFLGWNSAAQLISAVNWQIEKLLLGKLQPAAKLGLFSTGNDVAAIPFLSIFAPILRPLYAAFVKAEGDSARLKATYQKSSAALLFIGLPMMVGESCLAEPVVRLILGPKWLSAAPLVQLLALTFIPALFALSAGPLFMALGNTKLFFWRNGLEFVCKFPTVIFGAVEFGFYGVIFARVFSEIIANLFSVLYVRRLIGLTIRDQVLAGWRSVLSASFMASMLFSSQHYVQAYGQPAFIQLAVSVPFGAIAYLAAHFSLWFAWGQAEGVEMICWNAVIRIIDKIRVSSPTPTIAEIDGDAL